MNWQNTQPKEQIQGTVERVTFHNETNGFCVLRAKVKKQKNVITIVGNTPSITAGEYVECEGIWLNDKKHGLQFKAVTLSVVQPTTLEGIENQRFVYAIGKNTDAQEVNLAELTRVNEWNVYFCPSWSSYHANPREIYSNYGVNVMDITSSVGFPGNNKQWTNTSVQNAILNDSSSLYFVPFTDYAFSQTSGTNGGANAQVQITFELPLQIISLRDNAFSYWEMTEIDITWHFLPNTSESRSTEAF